MIFVVVFVVALIVPGTVCAFAGGEIGIDECAKSACLVDYNSGRVLYERNADEKLPIASMVKIMTLLITFDKIECGELAFNTKVTISENASAMGGSQMFLEAGDVYTVSDLIKGITVCSANDASVAMAETICGSTAAFVDLMNQTAQGIGMHDTVFVNATGLPADGQYSTAKDVSKMMARLLKHDDYYKFSKITMEEYRHPDGRVTQMVNTNKLLRSYKDCDGGKTGFTNVAMFCLSATAKRSDMRVIATVIGAQDSKTRFAEVTSLFSYAFAKYEMKTAVDSSSVYEGTIKVKKGVESELSVKPKEDVKVLCKKGSISGIKVDFYPPEFANAPVMRGDVLGRVVVTDENGNVLGETELVATKDIGYLDFSESLRRVLRNWLTGNR